MFTLTALLAVLDGSYTAQTTKTVPFYSDIAFSKICEGFPCELPKYQRVSLVHFALLIGMPS